MNFTPANVRIIKLSIAVVYANSVTLGNIAKYYFYLSAVFCMILGCTDETRGFEKGKTKKRKGGESPKDNPAISVISRETRG